MRRTPVLLAALLAGWAVPASAGLYTDDLTRCVVSKASDGDKIVLIRWIFAAMSVHPQVRDLSASTPAQRETLSKQVGVMIGRLVADDCHAQSIAAIKYEGAESLKNSFEVLGRVAMMGLMSDPAVQKSISGLSSDEVTAKFKALGKEAGVPEAADKTGK